MICVLLVSITLRAEQLSLVVMPWGWFAMYSVSCAIVGQLALSNYISAPPPCDRGGDFRWGMYIGAQACWWLVFFALYGGIAAILMSVFAMEKSPYDAVMPYAADFGDHEHMLTQ